MCRLPAVQALMVANGRLENPETSPHASGQGDRPERAAEDGERYAHGLPRTHASVPGSMLSHLVGVQNGETRRLVRNIPKMKGVE